MNGIIRVFSRKTSYSPDDEYVFFGIPQMDGFIPEHREIHISCVFTWDKAICEEIAFQWECRTDKPVKIGGPAFQTYADDFTQGMYTKPNIVFTSRGCNNNCPWCIVPKIEGKLHEIPICRGNVVQDNNFLQTNREHKDKVFDMLKTQRTIQFKGGLEVDLIDDHFVNAVTGLSIDKLWLACDTDGALPRFKTACEKLTKAGFNREKIHCYALIGDDIGKNEARLREIYEAGAMPHAQLYRDFSDVKTEYNKDWKAFERMWKRPAATNAHMKKGTRYQDFNT